jgi:hypothetical protein
VERLILSFPLHGDSFTPLFLHRFNILCDTEAQEQQEKQDLRRGKGEEEKPASQGKAPVPEKGRDSRSQKERPRQGQAGQPRQERRPVRKAEKEHGGIGPVDENDRQGKGRHESAV